MRLLIITQYFPPETGAPQNRLMSLAKHLKALGVDVEVLTAMPNYPKGVVFEAYRGLKFMEEQIEGITVYRAPVFATTSKSIGNRLRNYFSFAWNAWRCGVKQMTGDYDFVLCESPPLFLGISAVMLAKRWKAALIMNISDLWPESAVQLGIVRNRLFIWMAARLEHWLYRKSQFITGQTQGIVHTIRQNFPGKKIQWLPNGIDMDRFKDKVQSLALRQELGVHEDAFIVLYAGIIGHAQGLEIIPEAAKILEEYRAIHFVMVGTGPVKSALEEKIRIMDLANVWMMNPVTAASMPGLWAACDAAVVPLRNLPLFRAAIPSKLFEALAMKKPVLLGVEGEAKELFIDEASAGIAFTPGDAQSLAAAVLQLYNDRNACVEMGQRGCTFVSERFNRAVIANDFYHLLKNLEL